MQKMAQAPHFLGKVRDTEFRSQIEDLSEIRDGSKKMKKGYEGRIG
ncbi:hypothetical protein KAS45_06825 [candidate division WOR-3 bacterium]|nr:hypothetical protein [candidate division WOR-3 bacterium]